MSFIQNFFDESDPKDLRNVTRSLVQSNRLQERRTLEVNELGDITSSTGRLLQGSLSLELKANQINLFKFNGRSASDGFISTPPITFSKGSFTRRSLFRIELTGFLVQNTGANQTITPAVTLTHSSGSSQTVSAGASLTLATSTTPRGFRYIVEILEAPQAGGNVQCEETFLIDRATADHPQDLMRATVTTLSGSAAIDEVYAIQLALLAGITDGRFQIMGSNIFAQVIDADDRLDASPAENSYFLWRSQNVTDTFLNSNAPTTNYGTATTFNIGETNSAVATYRALVRDDDLASIPSNMEIVTVVVYITVSAVFSSNARTLELYRCLRNWIEAGATWNTYDGSNAWGTGGCGNNTTDYDGSVVWGTQSIAASEAVGAIIAIPLNANGIEEFKKWINGTNPNYGLLFKVQTESNDAHTYHSSESASPIAGPWFEVQGFML